jgi:hypothetical protein
MKLTIVMIAILIALMMVAVGEEIRVGPITLGIDLSAFNNANITYSDNASKPFTITDYDGYWFEEHRTSINGDENKTLRVVYRKFANAVSPNNLLALYDMSELDSNHYDGNGFLIMGNWIILKPDGTPAGVFIYSNPYPENNSHAFQSYWLSNRDELIVAFRNLTCEELNSTINSIFIYGYEKNQKFFNSNMHCKE